MKKGSYRRFVALCLFGAACSGLSTGCTLTKNVWFGFGAGLGGIPAQIVGNYIAGLLFPPTP
jgi:hypothetical protein